MIEDMISIIVPIYNIGNDLNRCMQSIVEQTYSNIEIILIDDGSTDHSPQLCDEWQGKDTRIQVVHKSNAGVSEARNTGLDLARGEFILFVDPDDYIEANMCQAMYDHMMESPEIDVVICPYYKHVNEKPAITELLSDYKLGVVTQTAALENILIKNVFGGYPWNKFFRKSRLETQTGKPLRFEQDVVVMQDFLFMTQLFLRCNTFKFIDVPLYHYMISDNGSTGKKKNSLHRVDTVLYVKEKIMSLCGHNLSDKTKKEFYAILYRGLLIRLFFVYRATKEDVRMHRRKINKYRKQFYMSPLFSIVDKIKVACAEIIITLRIPLK